MHTVYTVLAPNRLAALFNTVLIFAKWTHCITAMFSHFLCQPDRHCFKGSFALFNHRQLIAPSQHVGSFIYSSGSAARRGIPPLPSTTTMALQDVCAYPKPTHFEPFLRPSGIYVGCLQKIHDAPNSSRYNMYHDQTPIATKAC